MMMFGLFARSSCHEFDLTSIKADIDGGDDELASVSAPFLERQPMASASGSFLISMRRRLEQSS